MPQITSGIRSILSLPSMYSLFGWLVGGNRSRPIFVENYIRPQKGDRILDIGCGPGDLIPYLTEVEYLGFDLSEQYIEMAQTVLKPGGRLITFDGVFVDNQSPCAKWIISKDRGQNVRTKDGYIALASKIFPDISCNIRHDLLRIPYTHIILECTK